MFIIETLLGLRRPCGSDDVEVNEAGTGGTLVGHVMGEAGQCWGGSEP